MNNSTDNYDVVVVGAGMIGAATALGLAQAGLHVALLEHQLPDSFDAQSQPDVRISAISCASVALLKELGAWKHVLAMRCAPYRSLETWEQPGSNIIFTAQELGLPELGFMVENRVLQLALYQEITQYANIELISPVQMQSLTCNKSSYNESANHSDKSWCVTLNNGRELSTKLVIGADGARSQVRTLANIGSRGWQYRQSCMLITVKMNSETPCSSSPYSSELSKDRTWQQFFPSGPRAFLPLYDNWASLVWYDSPARIRQLQKLSMPQLELEIKKAFPERVGDVTPIACGSFPLVRHHASQYVLDGLALVGDSAHTINPLAGQGVNLGYRDVDTLLTVIRKARECCEPWYSLDVLKRYQRRRKPDNLMMQTGMDIFHYTFSCPLPGLQQVRNLALKVADKSGELKKQALKYALGL